MKKVILVLSIAVCYITGFSQETGTFQDPRDGKIYKTIAIGKQTIMSENYAYELENGNFWAYENNEENISKFGYLYDWETANKIAPKGWHLPTKEEWDIFCKNFGNNDSTVYIGTKNDTKFHFNPSLGGFRSSSGDFDFIGISGYFWSSTTKDNDQAWRFNYNSDYLEAGLYYSNRTCGFSVRLFKD